VRYPARPSFQVEIKRARGSSPRIGIENAAAESDTHRLANRLLFGGPAADANMPPEPPAEPLPESKAVPSAPRILPDLSQPDPSVSRTEEADQPAPGRRAPRAARPPARVTSRSDGAAGGGEGRVSVQAAERAHATGQRSEEPEIAAEFSMTSSSGDAASPRGTYEPGWRRADPAKPLPRGERWKRRLPRACW
jgi:hypothetical protein